MTECQPREGRNQGPERRRESQAGQSGEEGQRESTRQGAGTARREQRGADPGVDWTSQARDSGRDHEGHRMAGAQRAGIQSRRAVPCLSAPHDPSLQCCAGDVVYVSPVLLFVSGPGERRVEQGLLLPNGAPGPLRFTPCPQPGFAIGPGKSGDRKESTSRVEKAIGKPSQWRFACLRF